MKNIVLSGNTAWSMYNFRGGLIKKLCGIGYKIFVVAPADAYYTPRIELLGAVFVNIDLEAKGTNPLKDLVLIKKYIKIFRNIKPDIVFSYTIKPNIYGSFAAQYLDIPCIAITTGLGYTFLNNNIVSKIAKLLYKVAFKRVKQVWFLNNDDFESFIQYDIIHKNKGFVINGEGVNLERFEKSNNQTDNVIFLLMCRMLWDKGVGEFVEAAGKLKDKYPSTKFELLGFMGVDNPSAISKTQMDIWQREGNITYLGSTDNVVPYIMDSSCVVLPSYREGVPITLLEAASMCKPIITTDNVGCRVTVDDGVTGFMCAAKDVDSLSSAMEKIILMTPKERQMMGENGRRKMEKEFDEKIILNHYIDVLDNLI